MLDTCLSLSSSSSSSTSSISSPSLILNEGAVTAPATSSAAAPAATEFACLRVDEPDADSAFVAGLDAHTAELARLRVRECICRSSLSSCSSCKATFTTFAASADDSFAARTVQKWAYEMLGRMLFGVSEDDLPSPSRGPSRAQDSPQEQNWEQAVDGPCPWPEVPGPMIVNVD